MCLERGGEGHRKGLGELTHRQLAVVQPSQHLAARPVGEGVEDVIQLEHILNHMVDHRDGGDICQPIG